MRVPGNYAAWVSWLDAFARGEDLPSEHLQPVDASMGPQMHARLVERIAAAFEARCAAWGAVLQRDLDAAARRIGSHAAVLVDARVRLGAVARFVASPLLPEALQSALRTSLESMVRSSQESLEDSARRGADPERQLAVVRDNTLLVALGPQAALPPPVSRQAAAPLPARGRRVIL